MKRLFATGVGALAILGMVGAAAVPAQATETTVKPFELTYGASYWRGTVTFSNRSGTATGLLHSVAGSGCRFGTAAAYIGNTKYEENSTPDAPCNGQTFTETATATADVPGGPDRIVVGLWVGDSDGSNIHIVRSAPIYR